MRIIMGRTKTANAAKASTLEITVYIRRTLLCHCAKGSGILLAVGVTVPIDTVTPTASNIPLYGRLTNGTGKKDKKTHA